ncbi:FMN-dependent NADH-azoreductase [Stackebrandtia endophytica]|uniref:FMN dependent NADH:quinone oxidoreductase n=1 Tax=Stackebrandtia endophytica TaxID=1496996 RepID=A0A543AQF4_9ACTN|nr:NAD(P)H-dependent oxidoreductase [Stackebrandtia endophytica]TQL74812.1 FMN-dependent NADH-azoreductase [Stackebrandtia endophytica]
MATLLHLDSSINGARSHSRRVTATFAQEWQRAHPGGRYLYRDLATDPPPLLDAVTNRAANTPEDSHTTEEATAWRVVKPIVEELIAADTVLIGAPMYNFTIPASLKTWLDQIAIQRFRADDTGTSRLSDKSFVIATSRGGAYGPGTPRESFDHQEPYLRSVLSTLGVPRPTFLHTEMALSLEVPDLAQFKDIFETSSRAAQQRARDLATN